MSIKAIETRYKGYRFRSRLEARWAVFFDALGLKWEYEPEGFVFSDGTTYLPDFRVHGERGSVWVEIKPVAAARGVDKIRRLTEESGQSSALCVGDPGLKPFATYDMWDGVLEETPGIFATDKYSPVFYAIGGSGPGGCLLLRDWVDFDRLHEAVRMARSSRFEHGENGGVL